MPHPIPKPQLPSHTTLPGQGRVLRAFGDELHFHLEASHTGGQCSLWTELTPPGGGPPPHFHQNEDETFLPLEGRVEFFENGTWTEVLMGTAVFMPRGTVHAFRNPGDRPLKMLIQTTPGGFEDFFAECVEEFKDSGSPDMQRIVEISARYGIYFVCRDEGVR